MDNQNHAINRVHKGYCELSQTEIDLINECKELSEKCGELMIKLETDSATDKRNVALGKTNLQQGFMWAIRSIAQPTTF
jgi:hypothetical protein